MSKQTFKLVSHGKNAGRAVTVAIAALIGLGSSFNAKALRSVTLGWNPSSSSNLAGYYVYTHEENAALPTRHDAGPNTQATISGLKEGLNYRFTVTAYNGLGLESLPSDAVDYFVPVPLELMRSTSSTPSVRLRFPMVPGRWYDLQASSDLRSWTTIWQTGGALIYTLADYQDQRSGNPGSQFYRLIIR